MTEDDARKTCKTFVNDLEPSVATLTAVKVTHEQIGSFGNYDNFDIQIQ